MTSAAQNNFTLTPMVNAEQTITVNPTDLSPIDAHALVEALRARTPEPKKIIFDSCYIDRPEAFFAYMAERPALLPVGCPNPKEAIDFPFAGGLLQIVRGGERVVVEGGSNDKPIHSAKLLAGISKIQSLTKLEFQEPTLDKEGPLLAYFSGPESMNLSHISISVGTEFASLDHESSLEGRAEALRNIYTTLAKELAKGERTNLVEANIADIENKELDAQCRTNGSHHR